MGDGDNGEPRKRNSVQAASAFLEWVAAPSWSVWRVPQGAAAAWLATHLTAMSVFATMVAASSWDDPWRQATAGAWVAVASGLVARVASRMVATGRTWGAEARRTLVRRTRRGPASASFKAGGYLAASQFTFVAIRPLGGAVASAFVAVIAVTLGARVAGLESCSGRDRPAGFYVRAVVSRRGAVCAVVAIASSASVFWLSAVLLDPLTGPGATANLEEFLGHSASRWEQFSRFVVSVVLLAPPVLGVCEAISAVGRYERPLQERLVARVRSEISTRLHDDVNHHVDALRRLCTDGEQVEAVWSMQMSLDRLKAHHDEALRLRPVYECTRKALQLANLSRLRVHQQAGRRDLTAVLPPGSASALERFLLGVVGNSGKAGARRAVLTLEATRRWLTATYSDDAGGFDPAEALAKGRGLADVYGVVEEVGGRIDFVQDGGRTVTRIEVPR